MEPYNKWNKNGFGETITNKGGKFSKEESEIVRQAVLDHCNAKQIDVRRLCSECEHKPELKGAWMEIAKTLPHRSVQSVYRHGLRLHHPFRRGAWSEDELTRLNELVMRKGKKWVAIQNILNRSADSCRDKYREAAGDFVRGRWKEHEVKELENLIRDHLKADPEASLLDIGKMVEAEGTSLPWEAISKKMGTRSRLSCFKKYQKMCGLFVYPATMATDDGTKKPKPTMEELPVAVTLESLVGDIEPGDIDMYLLSELAQTGAHRPSEVPWDTIRIDDAQGNWNRLMVEWQQQEGEEATEDAFCLPVCELARLLLDRKNSAKTAAETLEAVDLPVV